ncbi:1-phosphofructokinase [Clostridium sp. D33t1_170424_F3]|uniref:1-phosphofructokinase n=1 Tax=Clostridium sp. D33t1_170424_F3 TaxID=2787099 RepID=UPI0018AA74E4|nr:1-phosphofructokinase [Clostridium sp. D33t1_170424_F3]
MITTITLNAAIDKLYRLETFQPGKVNRVASCAATAGGKGLNVSRAAAFLGEPVLATGFCGGHSGAYLKELLSQDQIPSSFVPIEGETRTCINLIDRTGASTELLEPGAPVGEDDLQRFTVHFDELLQKTQLAVFSGSLPCGCPEDFYAWLIQCAHNRGVRTILDASGKALARGIEANPYLIKPNLDELEALTGTPIHSKKDAAREAVKLHESGVACVVISLGKEGALLACEEGVFEGTPPDVPVKNTVGCGDSMVAAFAVAIARNYSAEAALHLALSVSSANAMCEKTGFFHLDDLAAILCKGQVNRLG